MYLFPCEDGDDQVRVLSLPNTPEGELEPPEFNDLRVTLNQILAELEEAARAAMFQSNERCPKWYRLLEEEGLDAGNG